MKRSTKILLISAALVVVLPLTIWTGALLYWHIRIPAAVRGLEAHSGDGDYWDSSDDRRLIHSAGCRSLPYIVRFLEEDRSPDIDYGLLHAQLSGLALDNNGPGPSRPAEHIFESAFQVLNANSCSSDQTAAERREYVLRIARWWHEEGSRYHQWWRVWTRACPYD